MTTFRIGDIADQIRGVTYAKGDASDIPLDTHVTLLRAGNIGDSGLLLDDLIFVPKARVSPRQALRTNDVLIAASSGSLSVVGKAARIIEPIEGSFGAFCKVLRPLPGVDPGYFAHFFRTSDYRRYISSVAAGANINNLRGEDLDRIEIPFPPLTEQGRIAAILDEADAVRRRARQVIDSLAELSRALLGEAFESADHAASLAKLGMSLSSGLSVGDGGLDGHPSNRILKVSAVSRGTFDGAEIKPMPLNYAPPAAHRVGQGDLLMTRASGSVDLIACSTFVPRVPQDLYLPDKIWRVELKPGSPLTLQFVDGLTRHPRFRAFVRNASSGASGVRNISQAKILAYATPVPSAEAMAILERRLAEVTARRTSAESRVATLDTLFASLQHRAFRGEL